MEYTKSKQQSKKENPKQQFLLSFLPDLEQMNDRQTRQLRTSLSPDRQNSEAKTSARAWAL
jgi:hypothetical protein